MEPSSVSMTELRAPYTLVPWTPIRIPLVNRLTEEVSAAPAHRQCAGTTSKLYLVGQHDKKEATEHSEHDEAISTLLSSRKAPTARAALKDRSRISSSCRNYSQMIS
jgi:hypothetical protein